MASVALNLLNVRPTVEVDPALRYAPVAVRLSPDSWLALNADEAADLGQRLLDAAASLRLPEGVILKGNTDITPTEHSSLGAGPVDLEALGSAMERLDQAGISQALGFDRRAQPALGKAA